MTPEQEESTFGVPIQSIGNRGWEPRPLQVEPARWAPPGPWCPEDPEAFWRGWMLAESEIEQEERDAQPTRLR